MRATRVTGRVGELIKSKLIIRERFLFFFFFIRSIDDARFIMYSSVKIRKSFEDICPFFQRCDVY